MDASHFVRAVQRHALLVLVTATLAVALLIAGLFVAPQQYRATADVVVLLPDTQTGSVLATTAQAVSDFEGAIRSSAVTGLAAQEAGVPVSSVRDGLTTEPLVGGSVIEVTFTGSDPDAAETIVTMASREAILLLLNARLGPVRQRLGAAQAAMTKANEALEAFRIEYELIEPEEYFFQQQRRLADLQKNQDKAEIAGDDEAAASIQDRIDALVQTVSPLRTDFDGLRSAREQAAIGLQEAREAFATADASVQAAEEASSITPLPATRVPRTERLPSQLLVVVVIATALTIGMIMLLELLAPQGVTRAARPSDAEPEAPAAAAAAAAGGADADRPAASVPMRAASERAPRPVDAAEARPVPARAEPDPGPGARRPDAAPQKAPAKAAANRPRTARGPLDASAARAVSGPRELVPDRVAAEPAATSDPRSARGPTPDRAATTHEVARPDAGLDGAARTAAASSSDRAPAAGAPASSSGAATLESGRPEASSTAGPRPEAKPSTSSAPAKRSRSRSKKRRSRSASDDARPTPEASQSAHGASDRAEAPTSTLSDAGHVAPPAPRTGVSAPPEAAGRDASPRRSEAGTSGRQGKPAKQSGDQHAAPSDVTTPGGGRSTSSTSASDTPSGEGFAGVPRASETSSETGPAAEAAATAPRPEGADASAVPDAETGATREPPGKVKEVETSSEETAGDSSRAEPRRDASSELEDRSARTGDAPAQN